MRGSTSHAPGPACGHFFQDHRRQLFALARPAGGEIVERLAGQRQAGRNRGLDIHGFIAEDGWPVQDVIDRQRSGQRQDAADLGVEDFETFEQVGVQTSVVAYCGLPERS
jgi:hypothetical protein